MIPPVPQGVYCAFSEVQMQDFGRQCARAALEQAVSSIRQADAWRGGHGNAPNITSAECIALIRSIQSQIR